MTLIDRRCKQSFLLSSPKYGFIAYGHFQCAFKHPFMKSKWEVRFLTSALSAYLILNVQFDLWKSLLHYSCNKWWRNDIGKSRRQHFKNRQILTFYFILICSCRFKVTKSYPGSMVKIFKTSITPRRPLQT